LHLQPDRVARIAVREDAPDVTDGFSQTAQTSGTHEYLGTVAKPKEDIEAQEKLKDTNTNALMTPKPGGYP
jgi:hypothetical protein